MPRPPIGDKAMTPAERQRRHRDIVMQKPMTKAGAAAVVAEMIPVTEAMRSGASIALLVGVVLIQCYATRSRDGCAPLSVHATMAECRALAKEYGQFDTRALNVTGLPAVVSYHCVAAEPGA